MQKQPSVRQIQVAGHTSLPSTLPRLVRASQQYRWTHVVATQAALHPGRRPSSISCTPPPKKTSNRTECNCAVQPREAPKGLSQLLAIYAAACPTCYCCNSTRCSEILHPPLRARYTLDSHYPPGRAVLPHQLLASTASTATHDWLPADNNTRNNTGASTSVT